MEDDAASRTESVDILLVDDQPANLVALEAILGDLGETLVKAGSGKDALREVLSRKRNFAVILLDVQMPEMDGYETAALIRKRDASRHIPIIFLTAHTSDVHTLRGYDVGAVDYLFKPLDPAILRSKVTVFVELAKKTALIERQNRDLAAANQEIEAFSYTVSHDLRAPLRSISRFSEALLEDCGDQLDDAGKQYLAKVRESAKHMGTLIDGLLSLARVARSEVNRAPLDLSRIAREVARRLDVGPPTELVVEDGLTTTGDARLLSVVLDNLIGNACKYTRKQAHPAIHVGKTTRDGRSAFFVRDNGVGFDMTYADKMFRPFQRLHAAAEFDGHGIGLATVQRIVRRHGGQIWADGQVDKGATFYFTLGAD